MGREYHVITKISGKTFQNIIELHNDQVNLLLREGLYNLG